MLLAATFLLFCCPIVPLAKGTDDDEFPSSVSNNSAVTWDYYIPPEYYEINPTDAEFEAAESPTYDGTSEIIQGAILESYDINIYHYEAPHSGYYEIYTTAIPGIVGLFDTVGAVFEEQNFLGFTTNYEQIAYDDNGSSQITQDEFDYNFRIVVELDKYEDYYICVRSYGPEIDPYTLHIKPNLDTKISAGGGIWTDNDSETSLMYITKEQALFAYILSMDGVVYDLQLTLEDGTPFTFEHMAETYETNPNLALETANFMLETLFGVVAPELALTMAILDFTLSLISNWIDPPEEEESLAEIIYENCDVTCIATVVPSVGIVATFTIEHGLLVEITSNNFLFDSDTEYEYSPYDSTTLYGKEYHYGTWH